MGLQSDEVLGDHVTCECSSGSPIHLRRSAEGTDRDALHVFLHRSILSAFRSATQRAEATKEGTPAEVGLAGQVPRALLPVACPPSATVRALQGPACQSLGLGTGHCFEVRKLNCHFFYHEMDTRTCPAATQGR